MEDTLDSIFFDLTPKQEQIEMPYLVRRMLDFAHRTLPGTESRERMKHKRFHHVLQEKISTDVFERIKEYSFRDFSRKHLPTVVHPSVKWFSENVLQRDYSWSPIQDATNTADYILRNQTFYGTIGDGIGLNVGSLPFALNDKFMAGQTWIGTLGTRLVAVPGNMIVGPPYGIFADYVIPRFQLAIEKGKELAGKITPNLPEKVMEHPVTVAGRKAAEATFSFARYFIPQVTTFIAGQSWGYAGFLYAGAKFNSLVKDVPFEHPEYLAGIGTLALAAPLIGPFTDVAYQAVRVQLGLPATPEYRNIMTGKDSSEVNILQTD